MTEVIATRYTCNECASTRNLTFDRVTIETQAFQPKNAVNGLFIFSDIHRCADGILGINNLHIDNNSAVRSFEYLKLPAEKKMATSKLSLPSPTVSKEKYQKIRVTNTEYVGGFRLTIMDEGLDINLIVGDVMPDDEEPELKMTSKKGSITLNYYRSQVPLSDFLKGWLQYLIDTLEKLPPTKIGLFVDTLKYIRNLSKVPVAPFHQNFLRTILISHKISFSLLSQDLTHIKEQEDLFGSDTVELMIQLVDYMKAYPKSSLLEYTRIHRQDISNLIYVFLMLQQEGIIHINYSS